VRGCSRRAFSKHDRQSWANVRGPRSANTRRPQCRQTYCCLGTLAGRPQLSDKPALLRIAQLLRPVGEVRDEGLEVELVLAAILT